MPAPYWTKPSTIALGAGIVAIGGATVLYFTGFFDRSSEPEARPAAVAHIPPTGERRNAGGIDRAVDDAAAGASAASRPAADASAAGASAADASASRPAADASAAGVVDSAPGAVDSAPDAVPSRAVGAEEVRDGFIRWSRPAPEDEARRAAADRPAAEEPAARPAAARRAAGRDFPEAVVKLAALSPVTDIVTRYESVLQQIREKKRIDERSYATLGQLLNLAETFKEGMKQFNPHEEDNRHIDSLLAEIGALRGFYSITKHGLRGEFYIIVQDRGAITTKNHPLGVLDNDYDVANPALEDRKARSRRNPLAWNGMTSRDFVEAYVGALADSRNPDDITKRRGEGKAALEKLVKNGRVAVPIEVAAYMMTEHGVPKTQKYGRLVGVDTHYRFNEVEDQVIALGVGRGPYRAVEPDERTLGFVAERESHYESLLEALKAHRGEAEPEPAAGAAAPVDRPVPAVVPAARAPAE